jgi:hypothetical protein
MPSYLRISLRRLFAAYSSPSGPTIEFSLLIKPLLKETTSFPKLLPFFSSKHCMSSVRKLLTQILPEIISRCFG